MRTLLICAFSLFLAACGKASTTSYATPEQAFEDYVAALNNGDAAKAADYYDTADGFHWIERGHVQYETGEEAASSIKSSSIKWRTVRNDIGHYACFQSYK